MLAKTMKPSDAETYERARRLGNLALWTIDLQCRRLNSSEPEDDKFVLRPWSDFHFLLVALTRLRRAAEHAAKVPSIRRRMRASSKSFDCALPNLIKMRNVAEHIDDYATDAAKDPTISRKSLEVGTWDGRRSGWLGFEFGANSALSASGRLFQVLKDSEPLLGKAGEQDYAAVRHRPVGPETCREPVAADPGG